MKKSKAFKKFLAITLAGATMIQSSSIHVGAEAKPSKDAKSTAVISTLAGLGGLTIIALAGGTIAQANKIDRQQEEISILKNEKRIKEWNLSDAESKIREANTKISELETRKISLECEISKAESNSKISKAELERIKTELEQIQKALSKEKSNNEYWKRVYIMMLSSRTENPEYEAQFMAELITNNSDLRVSLECANSTIARLTHQMGQMEANMHNAQDTERNCKRLH